MPEDTPGAGAPTNEPTEGQQPEGAGAPEQPTTPPAPKPDSANTLIKQFAKERGVTVEELLTQFKTYEDAAKTERERMEADLNRYKSEAETTARELREMRARVALQDAVSGIGNIVETTAVVDLAAPLLTYGDDGQPDNIDQAIETVKAKYPRLFPAAAGSADGGKGGTGPSGTDLNAAMRAFMQAGGAH